ncbi:hypothetical protein CTI12_AA266580 [Artemisia annua]|uniref:Ulp1 protease family, C-terminal catalytic domain-containing protein n=1 Tax=Artemisia annua TaxID=35608 RepID=A0A2U1NH84_ARTAN|nr:hypothetical protein CTI12_AA266580 [Artemisia annua]
MRNDLFIIVCDDPDQPIQTEVEDALKTVGLSESTTSTKGDPKVKTYKRKKVAEKRKPQDDEPDEPRVTKKSKNKVDKSGSPSTRTRGANQKKFDEAYKKKKEDGKGKVNEGEPADKEYIEVSEDEEKKTYKRKKVAGKRKVDKAQEAGDDDIQNSDEEEERTGREEPIETNTTRKNTKMYQILRGRATAVPLYETMKKMGFRDLIDFPIGSIPTKLAFFVVNSLETDTMTLNLPNGKIPILPETVKEIFGIPMRETMLERQRGERRYDDPFIVQWRKQFPANLKRITTTNLSQVILETTNVDYMFKMNFLMLFANTMGCCDNSSAVKYTVLTNVLENDNVQDIDWCSYIWESAKYSKSDWKKAIKDKKEVVYYGPITFLMLVYLHYTRIAGMEVRRKVPACKNWNSILIKRRENIEVNRKKFGQVEVLEEMSEEEESNLKEEVYQMKQERIDNILSEKEILELTIDENMKIFKDDEKLKNYKKTVWRIFKQPIDHFEYQSEEDYDDEDDIQNFEAGESSHQQQKEDEDDNAELELKVTKICEQDENKDDDEAKGTNKKNETGESSQQHLKDDEDEQDKSEKNKDAGNVNEDGNKSSLDYCKIKGLVRLSMLAHKILSIIFHLSSLPVDVAFFFQGSKTGQPNLLTRNMACEEGGQV